ncbi:MAG: 2-oxoacid:acceptor oxidoreductase family protein [bacterium]
MHTIADGTSQPAPPQNVLIVGVGGQGVILISRVLARMCQLHGMQVKQNEVHGMAKRGGVVFSHVRFGEQVWSPTIPRGQADILVALEWAEGVRWLPHLKRDSGTFITDTQQIVPPFAFRDRRRGALPSYISATVDDIARLVPHSHAVDATGVAFGMGNPRVANTVLLGVLSTALHFPEEAWVKVLKEFAPKGTTDLNIQAFGKGRELAAEPTAMNEGPPVPNPAEGVDAQVLIMGGNGSAPAAAATTAENCAAPVMLEITDAWCKACDICVKMCPERCLVLNGHGSVSLTDESVCTGCRICEMLCPDFAIRVSA